MLETPCYRITAEPYYDNYALWDVDEEIRTKAVPNPSWLPLNKAAQDRLTQYHEDMKAVYAKKGLGDYEGYVPPLSEMPDTMDGEITVSNFDVSARSVRRNAIPPFPVTPGKNNSSSVSRAEKYEPGMVDVTSNAEAQELPKKTVKNFNRESRNPK